MVSIKTNKEGQFMDDIDMLDYEDSCDQLENAKECLSMIIIDIEGETHERKGDDRTKALRGVYSLLEEVHKQFQNYMTTDVRIG